MFNKIENDGAMNDVTDHALTKVPAVTLGFWVAFILTRPLGATIGDFIDKPVAGGGLALSRPLASIVIAISHGEPGDVPT